MHLHFERSACTRADSTVQALSWMGKVPDELPEDDGWRLNRLNYYQDGWLASGNARGIVGVTFTTCHCRRTSDQPSRTNYNMRGHRSEVTLVKWNEPYQRLASCDSSGIIFVWIKYEGRWSIELINDRNTQVTDFAWSHDGRMALICYQDGFVLVGSVAGQRYWSSMLNLDATISCGVWAPDDQQVLFGTSNGQILVNDVHGEVVAQLSVCRDTPIIAMAWSCEKFKMEETDVDQPAPGASDQSADPQGHPLGGAGSLGGTGPPGVPQAVLAVAFATGVIYLMKNYDDLTPIVVHTGLKGIKLEWSNSGETLAVAGVADPEPGAATPTPGSYRNLAKFYTADTGSLRFVAPIPCAQKPVTALTWGHNDKRLFIATGNVIHIAWVTRRMASLQLLSRLTIHRALQCEQQVARLHLPARLRALVANLFGQTVKCTLPQPERLREFVSRPPGHNIRLHCTVVRHDEDAAAGSATYTLFLEFLGGLVPLLKGRRASKLRPEFVIYDPQAEYSMQQHNQQQHNNCSGLNSSCSNQGTPNVSGRCTPAVSSDSEAEDSGMGCHASPRVQRRRRFRRHLLSSAVLLGGGSNSSNANSNNNNNNNSNNSNNYSITYNGQHGCLANQQGLGTKGIESRDSSTQRKENTYVDQLPENDKMVAITSNIWGTKFKLLGLVDWLPAVLGMVSYRTSLLHLQPRQMTLIIKELQGPKPHSNTRLCPDSKNKGVGALQSTPSFSEDDDDLLPPDNSGHAGCGGNIGGASARATESPPPIAPMTPKKQRCALTYAQLAAHDLELDGDNEVHVAEEVLSFTRTSHPSTLQISLQHGSFGASSTISTTSSSAVIQSVATQTSLHSLNDLSINGSLTPNGPSNNNNNRNNMPTAIIVAAGTGVLNASATSGGNAVAANSLDPSRETSPVPGPSRLSFGPMDQQLSSSSSPSISSSSSASARRLHRNSSSSSPTCKVIKRNSRVDPDQGSPVEEMPHSTTSEIVRAVHTPEPRWAEKANDIKYIDNEEEVSDIMLVQMPTENADRRPNGVIPSLAASGDSTGSAETPNVVIRDTSLRRPPARSDTTKRLTLRSAPAPGSPSKAADSDGSRAASGDTKTAACLVDEPGCCCEACQATDDERNDTASKDVGNHRVTKTCSSPFALRRNRSNNTSGSNSPSTNSGNLLRTPPSGIGDPLGHHHLHQTTTSTTSHVMSGFPGHYLAPGPAPLMNPLSSATSASILESGIVRSDADTTSGLGGLGVGGSLSPSLTPPASPPVSRSTPTTPDLNNRRRNKKQSTNHLKALLYSPLLLRKVRKHSLRSTIESSDDENSTPAGSNEDVVSISDGFRDLESLQKAYIRKKLKKRQGGNGKVHTQEMLPGAKAEQELRITPPEPVYREFTLHNKAPLWNEVSQVYQLDFGGRVTQESAKNFQIEFKGTQVMQFGRIDGNAYTLDFQYPFSALQAFAVALANVTQRLK